MTTSLEPFDENSPLGYYFHPPADPHQPGHPQLDVIIHSQPTDSYFDPEVLICTVATADGTDTLHIGHPWLQSHTYRVCAGSVTIEDRRHKRVAAFTFGGELQIDSSQARTLCHLTSPAPILENSTGQTLLDDALIDEVEILFAERRAAQNEDMFEQRLAAAEPLALYRACVKALYKKFDQFPPHSEDELRRKLTDFLHTAITAQAGKPTPSLAELL